MQTCILRTFEYDQESPRFYLTPKIPGTHNRNQGESVKKTIIIGGGAAGLVAAIAAAGAGADVTVLEHKDRVGKKILSTGNGKCNYTNSRQGVRYYRGEDPAFVLSVFRQFGVPETLSFFRELGICPKEKNGYYYPMSEQASAVLDVLRLELRHLPVTVCTSCTVTSVRKEHGRFYLKTDQGNFQADSCIAACGGLAFPKSGSDGSFYPHLLKLGHSMVPQVPALVQMQAKQSFFKPAAGIRSDATIRLYVDGREVCSDRGEVQLTEFGVSGIPAFQVSRYAARALDEGRAVMAELDFMPSMTEPVFSEELKKRFYRPGSDRSAEEALTGLFAKKLIPLFLKQCRIPLQKPADRLSEKELGLLATYCKHLRVAITGTKGFDSAQVTAGGIPTAEVDADTLESVLVPGLYFAGEVLDIDGICGGYNLQWAWSSGYVAGIHAAKRKGKS